MNTIEPVSLKELIVTDFRALMHFRVRKILMICSNYDAFILEEDGQIESQIYKEYIELNLSNPPQFVWVTSSAEARKVMDEDARIDMVMCMYNDKDKGIFQFAENLKTSEDLSGRRIPFVLLTHFSKEIHRRLEKQDRSYVDYIFSWNGNAELIVAIVKLFEDLINADNDILKVGVQAILLVEDSVRYYSTYLPELYKLVLKQSSEFLKETLNEKQRKLRKRSRPKILLATNYEDAVNTYKKYRNNMLGIISDVGFVLHKNDPQESEKPDAGIDLVRLVREDDPYMPIILQSSQGDMAKVAENLGVGFLKKYSKTLIIQLSEYIREEFEFGDFVFRDANRQEFGRAANLSQLQECIRNIPDDILIYNTSRNMLSKWFFARGLFTLANQFKDVHENHFASTAELRDYVSQQIHDYHALNGRGIIAHFDKDTYGKYIWFSRTGEGSLGGKARGLAFLNTLIAKYRLTNRYEGIKISTPRTLVVATDHFDKFILDNDLQYVIDGDVSDEEILSEFVSSRLPEELVDELKVFLKTVDTPLAVRSSSKLEDSNYQPFAGVYSTYMIPLTENKDQMLRMLRKAIKSVYASAFFNGSRTYIHTTGNLLSEEKMAVIIQSICGSRHGEFYYPMLSGVARSVNFYPIGKEKPEDGVVNLAFGLGKTVVDGGNTLRFIPKYPKRILQLSDMKIALNDTQKTMYALDLRPGAFMISRDDAVNLVKMPVSEALKGYNHPELVASTFSTADNRMLPGINSQGPRIITFDYILKYGRYPLAQILADLLQICKKEMMCDIEMEFAMDVIPESPSQECVIKLLQVRPVVDYAEAQEIHIEQVEESMSKIFIRSENALGSGEISGFTHILYVDPALFDSARTKDIASEISQMNSELKEQNASYILIGPGRWGSSDPWLGIPVLWSNISEAKLIVECAIPGFRIEPSQGTHFFQNITSLGIGYLTVDTVLNEKAIDTAFLESLNCVKEGKFVKMLEAPASTAAFIDRKSNKAVAGILK